MASNSSNKGEHSGLKFKNKYCHCGKKASLKISETDKHPNQLFYKCDNCKYFCWWEDDSRGNGGTSSNMVVLTSGGTNDNGREWGYDYQVLNDRLTKVEANLNGVYAILCLLAIVFICVLLKL